MKYKCKCGKEAEILIKSFSKGFRPICLKCYEKRKLKSEERKSNKI